MARDNTGAGYAAPEITRRMTAKTVQRILDKTANSDVAIRRRMMMLYEALPDEQKNLLDPNANPHSSPVTTKLQQYVEANAELFGLYAYRQLCRLFLGHEVSDKLLRRLYELDED